MPYSQKTLIQKKYQSNKKNTNLIKKKMTWNDYQINILIHERRERNEEYWTLAGNKRNDFWTSIAAKINLEYQSDFTYLQCKEKFQNLVRDYKVK